MVKKIYKKSNLTYHKSIPYKLLINTRFFRSHRSRFNYLNKHHSLFSKFTFLRKFFIFRTHIFKPKYHTLFYNRSRHLFKILSFRRYKFYKNKKKKMYIFLSNLKKSIRRKNKSQFLFYFLKYLFFFKLSTNNVTLHNYRRKKYIMYKSNRNRLYFNSYLYNSTFFLFKSFHMKNIRFLHLNLIRGFNFFFFISPFFFKDNFFFFVFSFFKRYFFLLKNSFFFFNTLTFFSYKIKQLIFCDHFPYLNLHFQYKKLYYSKRSNIFSKYKYYKKLYNKIKICLNTSIKHKHKHINLKKSNIQNKKNVNIKKTFLTFFFCHYLFYLK